MHLNAVEALKNLGIALSTTVGSVVKRQRKLFICLELDSCEINAHKNLSVTHPKFGKARVVQGFTVVLCNRLAQIPHLDRTFAFCFGKTLRTMKVTLPGQILVIDL